MEQQPNSNRHRPSGVRPALLALAGVVVGISLAGLAASGAGATVDQPVDAGTVQLVDANNPSNVLTEGDSLSVFNLRLPDGATCPGDSANDNWRVQSFILPASDDPGATTYDVVRPVGGGPRHAVYGIDTRPYVHALTEQNPGPGLPGRILATPPLTFAVFPAGTLPDGNYRVGLACTFFRETAVYWDTELTVTADPSVQPGELRWSVVGANAAAPTSNSSGGSGSWMLLVVGGVAILIGLLVLRRRNSRTTNSLVKEHQ